ncbi:MAG: helix-turn-helix domain-containing protein [Acidobacteriota bacterium]
MQSLMQTTSGNIGEACRISGLSRSRLYTLLKKHQIPLS